MRNGWKGTAALESTTVAPPTPLTPHAINNCTHTRAGAPLLRGMYTASAAGTRGRKEKKQTRAQAAAHPAVEVFGNAGACRLSAGGGRRRPTVRHHHPVVRRPCSCHRRRLRRHSRPVRHRRGSHWWAVASSCQTATQRRAPSTRRWAPQRWAAASKALAGPWRAPPPRHQTHRSRRHRRRGEHPSAPPALSPAAVRPRAPAAARPTTCVRRHCQAEAAEAAAAADECLPRRHSTTMRRQRWGDPRETPRQRAAASTAPLRWLPRQPHQTLTDRRPTCR